MKLFLIAAIDQSNGLGKNGRLPWKYPQDLKFFQTQTSTVEPGYEYNILIAGKITAAEHNLNSKTRQVYIVSNKISGQYIFKTVGDALSAATSDKRCNKIFIIGGAQIYGECFEKYATSIVSVQLTRIPGEYDCDVFFPIDYINNNFQLHSVNKNDSLEFETWVPKTDEYEYLNLISRILETGEPRQDRTGTGTISVFGEKQIFDISQCIPVITTRKIHLPSIIGELLWFLRGSTNVDELNAQGIKIWNKNSSREFLDQRGLPNLRSGDIGPAYGFQWRHFGAEYTSCDADYKGQGIDQINELINGIKRDPMGRRHLITAWNPAQLSQIALPPCHLLAQFNVRGGQYLDCQLYQRSADVALGVPFNITSYSILVYIIAHLTNLRPGKFIHVMGDTHIYNNHIDQMKQQLTRTPFRFPTLTIKPFTNIDELTMDHFTIHNYNSHPPIKMEMS